MYHYKSLFVLATRKCSLIRDSNQDFNALLGNQMNVSCECQIKGYEWSSRFGLCVDINECARGLHNCSLKDGYYCVNLPGGFDCFCQFGMVWNIDVEKCEMNMAFKNILNAITSNGNSTRESNLMQIFTETLTRSTASSRWFHHLLIFFCVFTHSIYCNVISSYVLKERSVDSE